MGSCKNSYAKAASRLESWVHHDSPWSPQGLKAHWLLLGMSQAPHLSVLPMVENPPGAAGHPLHRFFHAAVHQQVLGSLLPRSPRIRQDSLAGLAADLRHPWGPLDPRGIADSARFGAIWSSKCRTFARLEVEWGGPHALLILRASEHGEL